MTHHTLRVPVAASLPAPSLSHVSSSFPTIPFFICVPLLSQFSFFSPLLSLSALPFFVCVPLLSQSSFFSPLLSLSRPPFFVCVPLISQSSFCSALLSLSSLFPLSPSIFHLPLLILSSSPLSLFCLFLYISHIKLSQCAPLSWLVAP